MATFIKTSWGHYRNADHVARIEDADVGDDDIDKVRLTMADGTSVIAKGDAWDMVDEMAPIVADPGTGMVVLDDDYDIDTDSDTPVSFRRSPVIAWRIVRGRAMPICNHTVDVEFALLLPSGEVQEGDGAGRWPNEAEYIAWLVGKAHEEAKIRAKLSLVPQ